MNVLDALEVAWPMKACRGLPRNRLSSTVENIEAAFVVKDGAG